MPDNKLTDNEIIKALEEAIEYGCGHYVEIELSTIKDVLDLINRLQEKVDRLNNELTEQKLKNIMLYETAKEIEINAYKEFAEKLKKEYSLNWLVSIEDIDNLLKELVGEDK